jgi:DGQHR domain-containing protein
MSKLKTLEVPAIAIHQGKGRVFYSFAVDGKLLPQFATISRLRRSQKGGVAGYQRPEVLSHIAEIRNYLESPAPLLPNSVVIAFDKRVTFRRYRQQPRCPDYAETGAISIPIDDSLPDEEKPGWVVDGQQRIAAIRDAAIGRFPISVTAFIADGEREQREQFILVNSTKPLPRGLIYELLPSTEMRLPSALQRRRFPAHLVERLNFDPDSPFQGMIRTPTNPAGLVQDNSVLKMLENSLTDGVLYRFRGLDDSDRQTGVMLNVLGAFWGATACVFQEAWAQSPRRSRLMHGAGIVSMGFVMDAISERYRTKGIPTQHQFLADLEPLREVCRWTDGYWEFGPGAQRKWNELQNTPKDVQVLSNYLLGQYRSLVWSRPS